MDKELLLKRLSIIKLLYKIGLEQSYRSETTAFFAILSFHDSIEMFLKLAIEYKNINKDSSSFIGYWDKIPELTLKESMRGLNARRVNIKHKGQSLGKIDIEASRVNTTDFFNQNTPIIFGIAFTDISLFELIKFKKTKKLLISSQTALENGDMDKCIKDVTISFPELLSEYKETKKGLSFKSNFDFIEKINYGRYNSRNQTNVGTDKRVEGVVEKIDKNFSQIKNVLEVISLGLDYRKYTKFKILTPSVHKTSGGNYHFLTSVRGENRSNDNCQFLIDFVLECGLKLQEFDYEIVVLDIATIKNK